MLSTLIVAPTSTSAQSAVFRPEIEMDGIRTRVLVDQMRAVDASRLVDFAGRLEAAETAEVDRAGSGSSSACSEIVGGRYR
ncbi:MAG TPA: type II toxin-antitoxin system PemK/MazF family toxin [Trebonia sp.]|nr:type II toxin-antitoxin system PemK/MazF family toxin [Trebonia sp.]